MINFTHIVKLLVIYFVITLGFTNCNLKNPYQKSSKELDSLKIVVEEAIVYFGQIDSAKCTQQLKKAQTYCQFISDHLKDTVLVNEAENIQLFCSAEKPMQQYVTNRKQWLYNAHQSVNQLNNLLQDLKNNALEPAEAVEFISKEKINAEKIIDGLKVNTQLMRQHLDNYQKSVLVTEQVIKKINNNSLPPINN